MKFKGLVILSLIIPGILSLSYAFFPKWSPYLPSKLSLTKIVGTILKTENIPALTVIIKTTSGEKQVILGPIWLRIKELKMGSKIEVEGFESPVTKIFKAVKVSADGKEILNWLNPREYNVGKLGKFRNFQNCSCLNCNLQKQ